MFQHQSCKAARFSVQSPFSILMTPLSVCVIFSVKTKCASENMTHGRTLYVSCYKHFIHPCISTDLVGVKNLLYISVHEFESQKILIFFINLFKVLLVFNFELIEINFMKNLSHFFFLKESKRFSYSTWRATSNCFFVMIKWVTILQVQVFLKPV